MKNVNLEMEGFYQLQVLRADGTVKFETPVFKNMIVDSGLDQIPSDVARYAVIGSGSTPPAYSDMALQSPVGSQSNAGQVVTSFQNVSPYVVSATVKYLFSNLDAGVIREVGLINFVGRLFSRALIVDGSNNPAPITLEGGEDLNVFYMLKLYPKLTDRVSNIVVNGVTHECRMRASSLPSGWSISPMFDNLGAMSVGFNPYSGDIGTIQNAPSGSTAFSIASNISAYIQGSKELKFDVFIDLLKANFELGVKSVLFEVFPTALGYWQCSFTPPLPKNSSNILAMSFKISWSRKT